MGEAVDISKEWLSPREIAQLLGVSLASAIRISEKIPDTVDLTQVPTVTESNRIRRHRTLRVPRAGLVRFLHSRKL